MTFNICDVPAPILHYIISYLDFQSWESMDCTCKRIHEINTYVPCITMPNNGNVRAVYNMADWHKKRKLNIHTLNLTNAGGWVTTPYFKNTSGKISAYMNIFYGPTINYPEPILFLYIPMVKFLKTRRSNNKFIDRGSPLTIKIGDVQECDLSHSSLYSISPELNGIHKLNLTHNILTKLPKLSNIHTLNLSHNPIRDVSMLKNIHTLILINTLIEDVSMLGGVHTLNLRGTKVVDVSSLGNVYDLNLRGTTVVDVSALGRVHKLNLRRTKVVDVSALVNVYDLNLQDTKVKDISTLRNVYKLNIFNTKVKDINGLKNVKILITYENHPSTIMRNHFHKNRRPGYISTLLKW